MARFVGAPLRSGWARGQEQLAGGVAVVDAPVGRGRVLVFGPQIAFRAQSHATFKFLFNAIFYSTSRARRRQRVPLTRAGSDVRPSGRVSIAPTSGVTWGRTPGQACISGAPFHVLPVWTATHPPPLKLRWAGPPPLKLRRASNLDASHEGQQNRMNRRHRLAVLAVCCCAIFRAMPVSAQANQNVPAGPLTLEQVLALAEARSETIGISRAGVQRAEGEQTRARSGLFPQYRRGRLRPRAGL